MKHTRSVVSTLSPEVDLHPQTSAAELLHWQQLVFTLRIRLYLRIRSTGQSHN